MSIAHGDNGTGMCKAESAGDDWLSDELQIDPIIDEPREVPLSSCCVSSLCVLSWIPWLQKKSFFPDFWGGGESDGLKKC